MDKFSHFKVSLSNRIAHIEINRPQKVNAFNEQTWNQYYDLFSYLHNETDTNVIILSGSSKNFCSGIDISALLSTKKDANLTDFIKHFQKCINAPIEFNIPVISVSHGISYGLAVDIVSATAIRLCSKDTKFSIKEIDVGIIADMGSLQRLGVSMGNVSKLNEWALTGSEFSGDEALKFGIVSDVLESKEHALERAFEIAEVISGKYRPAVIGTKKHLELVTLNNNDVQKGLNEVAVDNFILMTQKNYHDFLSNKFGSLKGKL